MRSRGGFSGSPVLVYQTIFSDLENINGDLMQVDLMDPSFLRLLGVHCSQYAEPVKVTRLREGVGDPIREGDRLSIPSSMTVIVPAHQISRLLDAAIFERQRQITDR